MIDRGKVDILGVRIDAVDYDAAVTRIIEAAQAHRAYGVSALAVHGVMTGVDEVGHARRLNELELVTPDGQPVRWAMNLLHKTGLPDRVYGPELSRRLLERAERDGLSVYFYGSTEATLAALEDNLRRQHPDLKLAGLEPSKFRQLGEDEWSDTMARLRASGADLVFVGLGCPRQEVFAYEARRELSCPVIAVGAAFDFFAGTLREPPAWVQRYGLQWLWRLVSEPRRLWRRYVILNPRFVFGVVAQYVGKRGTLTVGDPKELRHG